LEYLIDLAMFLIRIAILAAAVIAIMSAAVAAGVRAKRQQNKGSVVVTHLNREIEQMRNTLRRAVLDRFALRLLHKQEKRKRKQESQQQKKQAGGADEKERRKRLFVINFKGDMAASQVESLRQEVTTVLSLAESQDEVMLRLESPGGMVHGYGLASSQLLRIRERDIPLTICVDKVAASGGYMMACLGNRIVAAPFAILGSIGVLMQLPNFHRVLQKHDIDYEMITAGEYKRTLTLFGENTDKGRDKAREDVEEIHTLFKQWVGQYRPVLDMDAVATGETWFGQQAQEKRLIDAIGTSDDYIVQACDTADVYEVRYEIRRNIGDRFSKMAQSTLDATVMSWLQRLRESRYFS